MQKKKYFVGLCVIDCLALLMSACRSSDAKSSEDQDNMDNDHEEELKTNDKTDDESSDPNQKDAETPSSEESEKSNVENDNSKDTRENSNNINGNEETQESSDNKDSNESNTTSDDTDSKQGKRAKSTSKESTNTKIENMDEAVEHRKEELGASDEVNINDTEFIPNDESPKTDDKGTYYIISLESKSLKEKGGSGSVGIYNVYENGEYELAY